METNTSTTPALTSRQTKYQDLLSAISGTPGCSKADLTRFDKNQTRSGNYGRIDQLIDLGLVRNAAPVADNGWVSTYELHVTPAGDAELAYWDAR